MVESVSVPSYSIWVADPLTKDAATLLRYATTSFFAGRPIPQPTAIGGKECHLYMRSNDWQFILSRLDNARAYFGTVRLTRDGNEIELPPPSKDAKKPSDDMLGEGSSLLGGSC